VHHLLLGFDRGLNVIAGKASAPGIGMLPSGFYSSALFFIHARASRLDVPSPASAWDDPYVDEALRELSRTRTTAQRGTQGVGPASRARAVGLLSLGVTAPTAAPRPELCSRRLHALAEEAVEIG
jgi:hypothetical protein